MYKNQKWQASCQGRKRRRKRRKRGEKNTCVYLLNGKALEANLRFYLERKIETATGGMKFLLLLRRCYSFWVLPPFGREGPAASPVAESPVHATYSQSTDRRRSGRFVVLCSASPKKPGSHYKTFFVSSAFPRRRLHSINEERVLTCSRSFESPVVQKDRTCLRSVAGGGYHLLAGVCRVGSSVIRETLCDETS